jgi:hypothetical protein
LGQPATVADWQITIDSVQRNANATVIKASNDFITPPKKQYVLVTFEAEYDGPHGSGDVVGDLTWTVTGADNRSYDSSLTPPPAVYQNWASTVRASRTVRYQVVFDIDPATLANASLTVSATPANSFDPKFADFRL